MNSIFKRYANLSILNFIMFCKYNDVFFFSMLFGNKNSKKKTISSILKKWVNALYINLTWIKARILYYANNWIYTTNHKRIAVNYFWFVILSGIFGMVLATVIRLELAYPGVGIFAGDSLQYLSLATAHGVIMVFFMIIPLISGAFANFLLPTQLGVHDVAFPRLNSAAFWFLPGGLVMLGQLVCLDRRYQRMNCFNIREAQSLLKKRFFADLITSNDHRLLLDNTMIGLRFKTNDLFSISPNMHIQNTIGLSLVDKIRSSMLLNVMREGDYLFLNQELPLEDTDIFYVEVLGKKIFLDDFFLVFIQIPYSCFFMFCTSISNIVKKLNNFPRNSTDMVDCFSLGLEKFLETFYRKLDYLLTFEWFFKFLNFLSVILSFIWSLLVKLLEIYKKTPHFHDLNEIFQFAKTNVFSKLLACFTFFITYIASKLIFFFHTYHFFNSSYTFADIYIYLYKLLRDLVWDVYFYLIGYNSKLGLHFLTENPEIVYFIDNSRTYFRQKLLKLYNMSFIFLQDSKLLFSFVKISAKNILSLSFEDYWGSTFNFFFNLFNFIRYLLICFFDFVLTPDRWFFYFSNWFLPSLLNRDLLQFNQFYEISDLLFYSKKFFIFFIGFANFFFESLVASLDLFYKYCEKKLSADSVINFIEKKIEKLETAASLLNYFFTLASIEIPFFLYNLYILYKMIERFLLLNSFPRPTTSFKAQNAALARWLYETFWLRKKTDNHELLRRRRGIRFNTPVFSYDYKTGNYFSKFHQENMTHLLPTFADITGGVRNAVWFLAVSANDVFKVNQQNFFQASFEKTRKLKFFRYSRPISLINYTEGFYNFFRTFSEKNKIGSSYWTPSNILIQKFENMFMSCSMQQRIYTNWRQLKFTREAWRCKLLTARHQKSLFRRYVHENGLFWSIERNARDLLPGWAMITPFSSRSRFTAIGKVDIGVSAILLVLISSIISAVNFLVTYRYLSTLNNRKMRDARSFFTEGIMCSSWMMIAANPMLIIGLIMLLCDRHWQTSFFDYSGGGDTILFQHMFWFFGHPEVYIVIIPTFGFVNTLFSYYLRKRISARASLIYSIYTIAFLGFFVWGHHMYMVGLSHTTRMLFSTLTVMISVPAATKLMHWCVTMVNSSFVVELPFLFMIIYVFLFVSGGISGMCVAHTGMDVLFHDTFYVIGHFHVMFAGAAMFACFGAFYFYFSAIFGVKYSRLYAYMHFTYYLLGQLLTVIPMFWLGYAGMPRRVLDYPSAFGGWHSIITAGHMLSVAGLISFFMMIFDSLRQAKAATRTTLGVMRYNTRLNFYLYEISRIIVNQQRGSYLYRYYRPTSFKLNGYHYTNYEYLETTLYSYTFNKNK